MRTPKLIMSALALAMMTLWAEPASAETNEGTSLSSRGHVAQIASGSTPGRSKLVLAAMVAGLAALLLLRRNSFERA